jgi:type II secretory pathway component PulC
MCKKLYKILRLLIKIFFKLASFVWSIGQRSRPMVKAADSGENSFVYGDLAVELGENLTAADEHLGQSTVSDSMWLYCLLIRFQC